MKIDIEKFDKVLYFIHEEKVMSAKPYKIGFIEVPGEDEMVYFMTYTFKIQPLKGRPKYIEKYEVECWIKKAGLLDFYSNENSHVGS